MATRFKQSAPDSMPLATGLARHASNEGCQIEVVAGRLTVGQRVMLPLGEATVIGGTIRWALDTRVAMAFDRPLDETARLRLHRLQYVHARIVISAG